MHTSVHPAIVHHWKRARLAAECGIRLGCGGEPSPEPSSPEFLATELTGGLGGEIFGVRRPLRFMAYKLRLDDAQVAELAIILNDLKTERAQAAVDDRRTLTSFAEAISAEAFDETLAKQAADLRSRGANRLAEAVVKALGRIHKLLNTEQRERLAYLIRTGTLVL